MRQITLTIPQPCAESWDAMTLTAAGRHCVACRKTVVDFTEKTDAEVLALLKRNSGGSFCGRLQASQTGRQLIAEESTNSWRTWLGLVLTASSLGVYFSPRATAQTAAHLHGGFRNAEEAVITPVAATAIAPEPAVARKSTLDSQTLNSLIIRGQVLDSLSRELIPGAIIRLANSALATSSDINGSFALEVPSGTHHVALQVNSVGYASYNRPVTVASGGPTPLITVLLQPDIKGGICVR